LGIKIEAENKIGLQDGTRQVQNRKGKDNGNINGIIDC
jgi:hypothetical protein